MATVQGHGIASDGKGFLLLCHPSRAVQRGLVNNGCDGAASQATLQLLCLDSAADLQILGATQRGTREYAQPVTVNYVAAGAAAQQR